MQIVIDIPEDVLKRTVFYREFKDLNDCVTTIKALEKAVPLPKNHGRLIDADEIHEMLFDEEWDDDGIHNIIDDALTIIDEVKADERAT